MYNSIWAKTFSNKNGLKYDDICKNYLGTHNIEGCLNDKITKEQFERFLKTILRHLYKRRNIESKTYRSNIVYARNPSEEEKKEMEIEIDDIIAMLEENDGFLDPITFKRIYGMIIDATGYIDYPEETKELGAITSYLNALKDYNNEKAIGAYCRSFNQMLLEIAEAYQSDREIFELFKLAYTSDISVINTARENVKISYDDNNDDNIILKMIAQILSLYIRDFSKITSKDFQNSLFEARETINAYIQKCCVGLDILEFTDQTVFQLLHDTMYKNFPECPFEIDIRRGSNNKKLLHASKKPTDE